MFHEDESFGAYLKQTSPRKLGNYVAKYASPALASVKSMPLFQFVLGRGAIFATLAFGFIGLQDFLQRILKVFAGNWSALRICAEPSSRMRT